MAILLVLGADVGYHRRDLPWNASRVLDRAAGAFAAGSWQKAEGLLGALLLVVPGDVEIREKPIDCQKGIGKTSAIRLRGIPRPSWLAPYIKDS